jgi:hypothetical protein
MNRIISLSGAFGDIQRLPALFVLDPLKYLTF